MEVIFSPEYILPKQKRGRRRTSHARSEAPSLRAFTAQKKSNSWWTRFHPTTTICTSVSEATDTVSFEMFNNFCQINLCFKEPICTLVNLAKNGIGLITFPSVTENLTTKLLKNTTRKII